MISKDKMKDQNQAPEDPETEVPVRFYLEDSFKSYVQDKFLVENETILKNPTIMQMIYSLEWYDIPRTSYSELIEYHPYLTKGDYDKLYYVNMQHTIENSLSFALFTMVSNRLMHNRGGIFKRRLSRIPLSLATGGLITYIFN